MLDEITLLLERMQRRILKLFLCSLPLCKEAARSRLPQYKRIRIRDITGYKRIRNRDIAVYKIIRNRDITERI